MRTVAKLNIQQLKVANILCHSIGTYGMVQEIVSSKPGFIIEHVLSPNLVKGTSPGLNGVFLPLVMNHLGPLKY